MYEDKVLVCVDCGEEFVFTAGEQEFYAEKGFDNVPKRCRQCRTSRKQERRRPRNDAAMYEVTCARCGGVARVPFQPEGNRPVYCDDCFRQMRSERY